MKRLAVAVLMVIAVAASAQVTCAKGGGAGREVAGVVMPETVPAAGKTLRLNGMGLRTKLIFKVYVAGLYLENPTHDAAAAIASDQVKRVDLRLLRNLSRSQVTEAIVEGFEKNSRAQMPTLKARLDRFASMIPDVRDGDRLTLTYIPAKGTIVSVKGTEKGTIEGKDFADALFAVWLGKNPVQGDLKKAMLGG